jgi:hypothetical protein
MYSDDPGRMAATCDCVAVQASLETGKSVPLTKALRSAATRHLVTPNSPAGKEFR